MSKTVGARTLSERGPDGSRTILSYFWFHLVLVIRIITRLAIKINHVIGNSGTTENITTSPLEPDQLDSSRGNPIPKIVTLTSTGELERRGSVHCSFIRPALDSQFIFSRFLIF